MSYNGWVQYRRGILEHLFDGRLTGFEHYALSQLILMADAATGGYNVNAPILLYWMGYIVSLDTAQRILKSLHHKGYIWYRPRPNTKKPQPYWIDRYLLTKGPHNLRLTHLAELTDKASISQEDVYKLAVQPAVQDKGQDKGQPHHDYKTRNERLKTKEDSCVSVKASYECVIGTHQSNAASGQRHKPQAPDSTGVNASRECITRMEHVSDTPDMPKPLPPILVTGDDPYYKDANTGRRLSWVEGERLMKEWPQ